jgi:hypothetical protein
MADDIRVRRLQNAVNAEPVRRRKDGRLMRIHLHAHGDDYAMRSRHGNPQNDVHHAETDTNPKNVWTFKRSCGTAATEPHS